MSDSTIPLSLRLALLANRRPTGYGYVLGVASGIMFGVLFGVLTAYLRPGPTGATGTGTTLLVSAGAGLFFAVFMGVFYVAALRRAAASPPAGLDWERVGKARLRESGRLLKKGETSDDPVVAAVVRWRAEKTLRTPLWPRTSAAVFVLMTALWAGLLVAAVREGDGRETLLWGLGVVFGLFLLLVVLPTAIRTRRRAERSLAAERRLADQSGPVGDAPR